VLPDIDLKDSRPSRAMFAGLAIFFSFAVLCASAESLSVGVLWILWLGTLAFVRYGLHTAFHHLAVHRGIWHSILAALFCAAATTLVFGYGLDRHAGVAWLAGGFMLIGYLVHLTLDEIYSVDVMDTRLKQSFGTALKFFDRRHPYASAGMAAALALALWLAPSPSAFVAGISSHAMWAGLEGHILPKDRWFGVVRIPGLVATAPETGEIITTGAIPTPAAPQSDDHQQPDAQPQAEAPNAP
jgi:hypothetical protein